MALGVVVVYPWCIILGVMLLLAKKTARRYGKRRRRKACKASSARFSY